MYIPYFIAQTPSKWLFSRYLKDFWEIFEGFFGSFERFYEFFDDFEDSEVFWVFERKYDDF